LGTHFLGRMEGVGVSQYQASVAAEDLAQLLNQAGGWIADEQHLDRIAQTVYRVLGYEAIPRLQRKLQSWPQAIEEAHDLGQMAAIAFVQAYQEGRLRPDASTSVHTAESVASYLWGICNRVFFQAVRRSKRQQAEVQAYEDEQELDPLSQVGRGDEDDRHLWETLSSVQDVCRPEDLLIAYLHGSGFSIQEIRNVFDVSINTPANAMKRVGSALRRRLDAVF
jgi:DNA-directed RNA polymerase specialized sigma24 family protein